MSKKKIKKPSVKVNPNTVKFPRVKLDKINYKPGKPLIANVGKDRYKLIFVHATATHYVFTKKKVEIDDNV